jgi:eukaryotic-like serine/threonine-protein kinase
MSWKLSLDFSLYNRKTVSIPDLTELPHSRGSTVDKLLRAFETAWRTESPPRLDDFLPKDGSERQAVLPELVLLDLEFRLKRGEPVRVDAYLTAYPELARRRQTVLELLVTEFELRKRLDSGVQAEDYLTRFPEYAADLPGHFRKVLAERSRDGAASTMRMAVPETLRKDSPKLPGCEVLRELGRGGMGIVYLARQPALDRLVAVKVLRTMARADQQECLRFIREIQSAARLRHPHIVQLYEVGEVDGQPYCLLEYMEGGSLAERLQTMLPRGKDAAAIVETMARAMQFAHDQGIVHRDLKPANILLSIPARAIEPGESTRPEFLCAGTIVKIADFGLAKRLEEEEGHTRTGVILGTASYMSPEQAAGKPGDTGPATDVYALGAILYELLTGRPPFQGTTALSILEQVKNHDPVPPSRLQPRAPRDLETICLKCLEKEPRRRYGTALSLAEDLQRFIEGKHILARPTPWWEKAAKWSRRQPLAASILLALFFSMALGIAGISWQWYRAEDRAQEALAERAAKEVQRKEVINRFYFNQIARAEQAWASNRPLEASRLLEQCRDSTPELCGWEWSYLARQCQPGGFRWSGHTNDVRGLAITPDGRRLISGDGNWLGDRPFPGQLVRRWLSARLG